MYTVYSDFIFLFISVFIETQKDNKTSFMKTK